MTINVNSSYLRCALKPKEIRLRAKDALKGVQFDTVVGTGLSGLLPLHTVAEQFKVYAMAVRKDTGDSHATEILEGTLGSRWIFVDDFISTGHTFIRVYNQIQKRAKRHDHPARCVGAFLYTEMPVNYYTPLDGLINGDRGWCTGKDIREAVEAA